MPMPANAHPCARITAALGDLAGQEAVSLGQDDLASVLAIQDRAEPLVAFLAENVPALTGDTGERVRAELAAIFDRRSRTAVLLEEKLAALRVGLTEAQAARGRAARVAPVYGRRGATTARQLLAQG